MYRGILFSLSNIEHLATSISPLRAMKVDKRIQAGRLARPLMKLGCGPGMSYEGLIRKVDGWKKMV
jgi:hypothetical protein